MGKFSKDVNSGEKYSHICSIQVYSHLGKGLGQKRRGEPIKSKGNLLRWGSFHGEEF